MVERILRLMDENEVKASKLTKDTGLAHSVITKWKQGEQKPSTEAIIKLADYFEVSTDYLLGRTDTKNPIGSPGIIKEPGMWLANNKEGLNMKQRLVPINIFCKGLGAVFGITHVPKISDSISVSRMKKDSLLHSHSFKAISVLSTVSLKRINEIFSVFTDTVNSGQSEELSLPVSEDANKWPAYVEFLKLVHATKCEHEDAKALLKELESEHRILIADSESDAYMGKTSNTKRIAELETALSEAVNMNVDKVNGSTGQRQAKE